MAGLTQMPDASQALPGRDIPMTLDPIHAVLGTSMKPPFPEGCRQLVVGMGCFWGAERKFWQLDGVYTTAVGYSAGLTPNPSYQEVCTGLTGHNEVVLVVYDEQRISLQDVLTTFWESHDPTQGMRQGNDIGTQYRSGIYVSDEQQRQAAIASRDAYQSRLNAAGLGSISTEIKAAEDFYYAEQYHQQYLHKNPMGYCGLGGTGVCF